MRNNAGGRDEGGKGERGHLRARLNPQHAVQVHVEAPLVDSSLPGLCHWLRCAAEVRARQILLPCNTQQEEDFHMLYKHIVLLQTISQMVKTDPTTLT